MGNETFEPIRILEVIADQVTTPRNDGTRGSGLYKVPLRLSRAASPLWAKVFRETWDRPPSYSTMHRPGIARVSGDVVYLDGTTIPEIEQHHKRTLEVVVDETNRMVAAAEQAERQKAAADLELREKREREIREAASKLKF